MGTTTPDFKQTNSQAETDDGLCGINFKFSKIVKDLESIAHHFVIAYEKHGHWIIAGSHGMVDKITPVLPGYQQTAEEKSSKGKNICRIEQIKQLRNIINKKYKELTGMTYLPHPNKEFTCSLWPNRTLKHPHDYSNSELSELLNKTWKLTRLCTTGMDTSHALMPDTNQNNVNLEENEKLVLQNDLTDDIGVGQSQTACEYQNENIKGVSVTGSLEKNDLSLCLETAEPVHLTNETFVTSMAKHERKAYKKQKNLELDEHVIMREKDCTSENNSKSSDYVMDEGENTYNRDLFPKRLTGRSASKPHMLIDERELPSNCDMFDITFVQQSDTLKEHLGKRIRKKSFKCDMCEAKYAEKHSLRKHMRIHTGEKPFVCEICDAKYADKTSLSIHIRIHSGEKPFSCNLCNAKYSYASSLNKHKRTHTGEKPFKCDMCNAEFSQKGHLSNHMGVHTIVGPFLCDTCGTRFKRKGSLKAHAKIHTGEKPFSCQFCKSKFTLKHGLTVHIRTHTGEKPFRCHLCESKFTSKQSLHMHTMRTHRKASV